FVELGYEAWRPNFRGVGETEGTHDEGRGELEDLAAIVAHLKPSRLALAGFSFGAGVQVMLAQRVKAERLVLIGLAVTRFQLPPVQKGTLLLHGEPDEPVPVGSVLDWARPQELPVVVIPGADHFFHRRLNILRELVRTRCA